MIGGKNGALDVDGVIEESLMLSQWAGAGLLAGVLGGFCLPAWANTTGPLTIAQTDLSIPRENIVVPQPVVRIALLLPLQSAALREAAEAVRAGFQAGYEREQGDAVIDVIDSGDAPQDVVARYQEASAQHDIVVGPLSRSGVAAVAQSGSVDKPTIALTPPDTGSDTQIALPQQMLVMGLSIEDEARQAADWIAVDNPGRKALVLYTDIPWQRRAARAFELHWQQQGREVESIELAANDGFLSGRALLQLKKQIPAEAPPAVFAALDARQARQLRAILGSGIALYGTSQLNPYALSNRNSGERATEMDGTRLLDIPWQLEPDHPAVMVYPRLVVSADRQPNADLERLYALGIDAYRVAREIAAQSGSFELDGVTGRLVVQFGQNSTHFERTVEHAVYRDGGVVAAGAPQ
jgi:hypothetical protein